MHVVLFTPEEYLCSYSFGHSIYSMNVVACPIALQTILSSYAYEERQDLMTVRKDMNICIKTNNRQGNLKERKHTYNHKSKFCGHD